MVDVFSCKIFVIFLEQTTYQPEPVTTESQCDETSTIEGREPNVQNIADLKGFDSFNLMK